MIVLLNILQLVPQRAAIAGRLAALYKAATVLEQETAATAPDQQPLANRLRRRIITAQEKGTEHFILCDSFETPEALKQLRICLSRYDNEIYAFRVCFRPPVLSKLTSEVPALAEAYAAWQQHQEAGARYGDMGYAISVNTTAPAEIAQLIWDDIHEPIELIPSQAHWPGLFARERKHIQHALQDRVISIEHIGSTAIPNMPAKPVIDILLTVAHFEEAVHCIQPLRELGYAFIDYPQNTDRRFFRKGKPRSHHIHLVEHESQSARDHLQFRDALLTNPTLQEEYRHLKHEAMQQHKERRALYGERKTQFIRRALAQFRGDDEE
jgi:GrpB-like predicted nucleotidyltransferase (UPF0157 family)